MHKYNFSIIIPVYNLEQYLEEAVESIINQTIGFEDNFQLIFVNDGSSDGSEQICLKYKSLYPENVVYIGKENGGVSSARNEGMKHIQGKYVNFFDGDDKWDVKAFSHVSDFFNIYGDEIDAVSCRHCFFERITGFSHSLDYKYAEEGIVDLTEKPYFVQLTTNNVIIKADTLIGREFDTRLKISEDSIFIAKIIMEKMKYGILPSAVYHYRKRFDKNSAMDAMKKNEYWYFDTPQYSFMALIDYSLAKFGEVIPYCQYHVMSHLQYRIKSIASDKLSTEKMKIYEGMIIDLLQYIDDSIILKQKNINFAYKLHALNLKHGENVLDKAIRRKKFLMRGETKIFNVDSQWSLIVNILKIQDDKLLIEGSTTLGILGELQLGVVDEKNVFHSAELTPVPKKDLFSFTGERIFKGTGFKLALPIKTGKHYKFIMKNQDFGEAVITPSFRKNAKLTDGLKISYYVQGKHVVKFSGGKLMIDSARKKNLVKHELRFLKNYVLVDKEYKIAALRIIAKAIKLFKKKEVWILSDQTHVSGDNAEALFKYLQGVENKNIKPYFMLDGKSRDYNRMKKLGRVLRFNSNFYLLMFLCADKIISSHADDWVTNAFGDKQGYVKDMYTFDFIFLQHGIIKDDLSSWLHKFSKNIKMFVTSADREYQSVVEGRYGYDESVVKLTGLPRYDYLTDDRKKKIVFLPTWRSYLAQKSENHSSERPYSDMFKNSDYYTFFNNLINDKRLIDAMKENEYSGEFYVHPAFGRQAADFTGNDVIRVIKESAQYNTVFKENALLITDYSSVAFDFSYMKKPVIYSQFDTNTIFQEHIYKPGYFDYERDGFGPVCYDYEQTVNTIIDCLKNDCRMEDKYRRRVDEFFCWSDRNNCKRVYEEISKI